MHRIHASCHRKTRRHALATAVVLAFASCLDPGIVTCPSGLVCPPGTQCAAKQDACIRTECGNEVVDTNSGEVCDDGNILNGDGCAESCKSDETCGNGIKDVAVGEVCDDGNNHDGDSCSADCKFAEGCGNGEINLGEECDDGNRDNDDDCPTTCRSAVCGDGFRDMQAPNVEACDDGNNIDEWSCPYGTRACTTCNHDCTAVLERTGPYCGDGTAADSYGEICDDGNNVTEQSCDYGARTCTKCDAACATELALTGPFCGDGVTNGPPGAEVCDDGNNTDETSCPYGTPTCTRCNSTCSALLNLTGAYCGDGTINSFAGEVCDDGNASACGMCNATCTQVLGAPATGRITSVAHSQLSDGETFTLYDGINLPITFEFDVVGDGVLTGHVRVIVPAGANADAMAGSIESAIDHAAPLRIVAATRNNVVSLYHLEMGSFGNQTITETVTAPGFEVEGLSGGSERDCPIGVDCRLDSDCALGLTCQGTDPKTCQPSP